MAILYSYPTVTPETQDLLIGTEMAVQGGEDTPRTKTFTIGSISSLISIPLTTAINLKANIASPTFTGVVISPSFVKTGGLVTQYLMANGSTSTMPTLQQVTTAGTTTTKKIDIDTTADPTASESLLVNATTTGIVTNGGYSGIVTTGETYGVHASSANTALLAYGDNFGIKAFAGTNAGIAGSFAAQSGATADIVEFKKGSVKKAFITHDGNINANSFIKTEGGATEYLMADGNARIHTVTNSTQATAFTVAALNSTYPTATIGFTVQCTNGAVLKSYQKTSTGWISYTIANVA